MRKITRILLLSCMVIFSSCGFLKGNSQTQKNYSNSQRQLFLLLDKGDLGAETRFGVVNRIAGNMLAAKNYADLILFLSGWVENHPDDTYNSYWLLMTAFAYLENNAEPVAEYYFERIINNYSDLIVHGKSVHFLCLQHLIQISENSSNRINYFNQLISRFPGEVSTTELYYRLAVEYEKEGEWNQAINTYTTFLEQNDAVTIQIKGDPNAYIKTKQLIDFSNSSKDWTFESLDTLVLSVKRALSSYNYKLLDSYKSKVNFFAMSWRQDATDANAQESFSMRSFMRGNRIRYNDELDPISTPTEAYLRTKGWNNYVNVWYLYFRKVNFPADPEIHGRWEWAGIYFGEKL